MVTITIYCYCDHALNKCGFHPFKEDVHGFHSYFLSIWCAYQPTPLHNENALLLAEAYPLILHTPFDILVLCIQKNTAIAYIQFIVTHQI